MESRDCHLARPLKVVDEYGVDVRRGGGGGGGDLQEPLERKVISIEYDRMRTSTSVG